MTAPDQHSGNLLRRHHGLQPAAHEILQPAAHEVFSYAPTKLVMWASHEAPETTAKSPLAQLVADDCNRISTTICLSMNQRPRPPDWHSVSASCTAVTAILKQHVIKGQGSRTTGKVQGTSQTVLK